MERYYKKALYCMMIFVFIHMPGFTQAGGEPGAEDTSGASPLLGFLKGESFALQFVTGPLFSPVYFRTSRPDFNYFQTNLRFCWLFDRPTFEHPILRGNLEGIFELTDSVIFDGFGDVIAGITVLFRYNFVQPDARFIPYFQLGAGIVYTDAYKDESQALIGQEIEFTPQGSLGAHYMINENWSFDIEGMYHHISNAGLDDRNVGVNAFGGLIGFTYYFDRVWR